MILSNIESSIILKSCSTDYDLDDVKRIVITGASGFVGRNLRRFLVGIRSREDIFVDRLMNTDISDNRRIFIQEDLCNPRSLGSAICEGDIVVHLAATADKYIFDADAVGAVGNNVLSTRNIVDICIKRKVKKLIFASTDWVYEACPSTIADEESPLPSLALMHPYGMSKLMGEQLVSGIPPESGTSFVVLRFGTIYGPGMRRRMAIYQFINRALKGEPIQLFGDGSAYRYFVYVDDVCRAILAAMRSDVANDVFNIVGPRITLASVVEMLGSLVEEAVHVEQLETHCTGDFDRQISADRARQTLGWIPAVQLNDGLQRSIVWAISNRASKGEA